MRPSAWEALHPYSAGGAYVNFMMDEGQERVRATYRDNYDRLAKVKCKYDPGESVSRQPEHCGRDNIASVAIGAWR